MTLNIKPLGCSENELNAWRKMGISYDKRTAKQMVAAFNKIPGALPESINHFEKVLKITLPLDYRAFMLKYDGGIPEFTTFNILEDNNASVLSELFGLDTPLVTSSLEYNRCLYQDRIPADLLPIGGDVFGNRVVLGIKGERYGKIFFWDHENEAEEQASQIYYDNIFLISENFNTFLSELKVSMEN